MSRLNSLILGLGTLAAVSGCPKKPASHLIVEPISAISGGIVDEIKRVRSILERHEWTDPDNEILRESRGLLDESTLLIARGSDERNYEETFAIGSTENVRPQCRMDFDRVSPNGFSFRGFLARDLNTRNPVICRVRIWNVNEPHPYGAAGHYQSEWSFEASELDATGLYSAHFSSYSGYVENSELNEFDEPKFKTEILALCEAAAKAAELQDCSEEVKVWRQGN